MDYQNTINQLKKGSITIDTNDNISTYEPVKVQIKKCEIIDTAKSTIEHPLVNSAITRNEHTALVAFHVEVKSKDNSKSKALMVSYLLNKKGAIAYHGSFEANGSFIPASLLFEITNRCSIYSDIQKDKFTFEPKFEFNPNLYEGMIFEINAKKIKVNGEDSWIFETEYQKQKDKKYNESQSNKQTDGMSYSEASKKDDLELPF